MMKIQKKVAHAISHFQRSPNDQLINSMFLVFTYYGFLPQICLFLPQTRLLTPFYIRFTVRRIDDYF